MEAPPGTCFRKSKLHLAPAGISGAHKPEAGTTLHGRHRVALERPRPGSGRERREVRQEAGEGNMVWWDWDAGRRTGDLFAFLLYEEQCEAFPPMSLGSSARYQFPINASCTWIFGRRHLMKVLGTASRWGGMKTKGIQRRPTMSGFRPCAGR